MNQEQEDMLAIPLEVLVEAINKLEASEADLKKYVLVVPKNEKDKSFYLMEKQALFGGYRGKK